VTFVHWAFAVYGGLCCLVFLNVSGDWKLLALLMTVPPQLAWLAFVVSNARRKGLENWG